MKYLIIILIVAGCNTNQNPDCGKSVEILFKNETSTDAKLLLHNGLDSISLKSIGYATEKKTLCFSQKINTDGNYSFSIKSALRDTSFSWGYFSNGIPSEKTIQIVLKKDSLILKSIN